ncbi:TetR family transcriptional regulator [Ideonella sp. 4Y11]|uniref:TetR family transcriptional regulator n=1 Tax=Ideonella aquatica TaxID=2824119 RepID=A0A940YE66_9BURK|nr:TetR/AcrR family transcriptional regulator [Ideonella aquatica]MBQ0958505.1 TetR family transcriptional regulator [Ideonella aquatica]
MAPSSDPTPAEPSPRPKRPASGRGAPREDQPDRRTNILLAAEKLFALRGYHAVSIRDIAAEAGVPLALVGYYFGAKHELYHAIFETWSPAIAGRRQALDAVMQEPDLALRLERIVDTFVSPLIALHQHPEGQYYALMAARDLAAPTEESERSNREFFDPLAHAFIDALMSTAPGASRGQVAWCYQFMLGALLHFLSDRRVERLSRGENRAADPAAKERLLVFLLGGFRAVLGAPGSPSRPRKR